LSETWVKEKGGDKMRERLTEGYEWRMQGVKRRSKKGRTMGGMMMGIRKELVEKEKEEIRETEGVMTRRIRYGRSSLKIVRVYVNGDMENKLEELRE